MLTNCLAFCDVGRGDRWSTGGRREVNGSNHRLSLQEPKVNADITLSRSSLAASILNVDKLVNYSLASVWTDDRRAVVQMNQWLSSHSVGLWSYLTDVSFPKVALLPKPNFLWGQRCIVRRHYAYACSYMGRTTDDEQLKKPVDSTDEMQGLCSVLV